MGDLLFDLTRNERTLEGVIVEATFGGSRPLQLDLIPTIIVNGSRVDLLGLDGGGRRVLRRMERASMPRDAR
jgi:hypothetical protein